MIICYIILLKTNGWLTVLTFCPNALTVCPNPLTICLNASTISSNTLTDYFLWSNGWSGQRLTFTWKSVVKITIDVIVGGLIAFRGNRSHFLTGRPVFLREWLLAHQLKTIPLCRKCVSIADSIADYSDKANWDRTALISRASCKQLWANFCWAWRPKWKLCRILLTSDEVPLGSCCLSNRLLAKSTSLP